MEVKEEVKEEKKEVPLENRQKEAERLEAHLESLRKEVADLKSFKAKLEAEGAQEAAPDPQEALKAELVKLAENPKEYVRGVVMESELQKELPQAEQWVRSQEGFSVDDEGRMVQIIQEHHISSPSPMKRAKAAWQILQSEKLAKELASLKSNTSRETSVSTSVPEGSGRSAPQSNTPKRAELLKQLAAASAKNDPMAEARLIDALEDVRE